MIKDIGCTGCGACAVICPTHCIAMNPNKEGFLYPIKNLDACLNCHKCEKVCPPIKLYKSKEPISIGLFQSTQNIELLESSSGGVFSLIASYVLRNNGIVYGSAIDYNDKCSVKHIRIESISELSQLRGSKYVQSELGIIYIQVKEDIKSGRFVLFSGTPCQVAGLLGFLQDSPSNLITVDLLCHGVPSPLIWRKYLFGEILRNKEENIQVSKISFRDKRLGWHNYGLSVEWQNLSTSDQHNKKSFFQCKNENSYLKGFIGDIFLRESCYNCKFKGFSSGADITLGDPWGCEQYIPEDNIDKGASLVVILSEKGRELAHNLNLNLISVPISLIKDKNPSAYRSVQRPPERDKFFNLIWDGMNVSNAIDKILPRITLYQKIKWSIKRRLK